jgi:hypothetical protein
MVGDIGGWGDQLMSHRRPLRRLDLSEPGY